MILHGWQRDPEMHGDLLIRKPLGDQRCDGSFARREVLERLLVRRLFPEMHDNHRQTERRGGLEIYGDDSGSIESRCRGRDKAMLGGSAVAFMKSDHGFT